MADKISAKGTIWKVKKDGVFTAVPYVGSFNFNPPGTTDDVDVTTHDSPGNLREYINGLSDTSELSIPLVYAANNAVHKFLIAMSGSTPVDNQIILPTVNTTYAFAANLKGFDIEAPTDNAQRATVSMKITGTVATTYA
jgi:predicted secreted protein